MFVLCPFCQFLVTLDPVSGEPPEHCPRCMQRLQPDAEPAADQPIATATGSDAPATDEPGTDSGAATPGPTDIPVDDDPSQEPDAAATAEPAAVEHDAVEHDAVEHDAVGHDAVEHAAVEPEYVEPAGAEPVAGVATNPQSPPPTPALASPGPTPATTGHADTGIAGTGGEGGVDDSPAEAIPEPADALVEAMLGPASVEIEAATPARQPADHASVPEPGMEPGTEPAAVAAPALDAAQDRDPAAIAEPAGTVAPVVPADPVEAPEQAPVPAPGTGTPAPAPAPPALPTRKPAPSFVRRQAAASGVVSRRRRLATLAIVLLGLTLLLQLLLADRAQLAADARWRPALTALCGALHCTLPPWREPSAFVMLQRDVRPHPTLRGALQVTATFRNDARWAQPWPGLQLTLSDVDGHAVAARTFLPREYLDANPPDAGKRRNRTTQALLASGQSATIRLSIVEPTPRIVAFTFDFQ